MARCLVLLLAAGSLLALPDSRAFAQTLEATLLKEPVERLVESAQAEGDPRRGAVLFHQPYLGCTQCHAAGQGEKPLGPDLTRWDQPPTTAHLVEAILQPSRKIREGCATPATRAGPPPSPAPRSPNCSAAINPSCQPGW